MKPYGVKRKDKSWCCPGHSKYPRYDNKSQGDKARKKTARQAGKKDAMPQKEIIINETQ